MAKYEEDFLSVAETSFGVSEYNLRELSVREINLLESIKTPGLMTSVMCDSYLHDPVKDFDEFKNANLKIKITRPILERYGFNPVLEIDNVIYRLQNRKLINNNNENMTFQGLHNTQLEDASKLMSFSRKCVTPSSIVSEVLQGCLGSSRNDVESSQPARDYIAENIHPFQVIAQQADVSIDPQSEPSFVHFMSYENKGTHHFRSLYSLTQVDPPKKYTFSFSETGNSLSGDVDRGYRNPNTVLTYSFPCDFDLLSDLLNGISTTGAFIGAGIFENPKNKLSSSLNFTPGFCSTGATLKTAQTNINTAQDQDSCNIDVENHMLKRQARMGLLEQDKIALRLTIPWNAELHAGKVIRFERTSKDVKGKLLYGSGNYLIHTLTHIVKAGGYSTTVMDCVSTTVGQGLV